MRIADSRLEMKFQKYVHRVPLAELIILHV